MGKRILIKYFTGYVYSVTANRCMLIISRVPDNHIEDIGEESS